MKKRNKIIFALLLAFVLLILAFVSANFLFGKKPVMSPQDACIADVNHDGKINILDMIFIRNRLNQDVSIGDNKQADINKDGKINILDLIFVRNNLNGLCPPKIQCYESVKSGLCGKEDKIFPLENSFSGGSDIIVHKPGIVLDNDNFFITLEGPEFTETKQQADYSIVIKNKKNENQNFDYNTLGCSDGLCSRFYSYVSFNDIKGAQPMQSGKLNFYRAAFLPLEEKRISLFIIGQTPTLIELPSYDSYFHLTYYYDPLVYSNFYDISFQSWIKPDSQYEIDKTHPNPRIISCGGINQPEIVLAGERHLMYLSGKCCKDIFYPDAECCDDSECSGRYCIDGKCMDKKTSGNKLYGNKKILIGYIFGLDDSCSEIALNNVDAQAISDIQKMEQYYDHMANILLNKPNDFVNFQLVKVINVPKSLQGFFTSHNSDKTEQDILNELIIKCGLNVNDHDIIILPTSVSTTGEAAGWALGSGTGKIILYQLGITPTLIHETGHLFGCTDLYDQMGGSLQWGSTLYGMGRNKIYNLIFSSRINEITAKTFQVCRGELGWVDLDNNGIVDISEF